MRAALPDAVADMAIDAIRNGKKPIVTVSGNTRQDVAEIGVPQQLSVDRTHGFSVNAKYEVSPDLELRFATSLYFDGLPG